MGAIDAAPTAGISGATRVLKVSDPAATARAIGSQKCTPYNHNLRYSRVTPQGRSNLPKVGCLGTWRLQRTNAMKEPCRNDSCAA
jgi:hypothetical protein